MTDIEQKAREVAQWFGRKYMTPKRSSTYCIEDTAKKVAAAIQSAVDEERLENRKLFSIGMSDLRRESNYDRICDKVHQIDKAIRARGQKASVKGAVRNPRRAAQARQGRKGNVK